MAIKIAVEYVNAEPISSNYPGGSFKNETAPGALDGTPLEKAWADDLYGFGEAILAEAGVVHSGAPDNAVASDRLDALKKIMANLLHPVGSVVTLAVATDPATLFGVGTWVRLGAGRVVVDAGTGFTAGTTGGEVNHTLTSGELPAHSHPINTPYSVNNESETPSILAIGQNQQGTLNLSTGSTGGGAAHNNMPPYYVGYIWRRTA